MREVRTTCAYCGVGCGIRAAVVGEREVRISGDEDHPANFGRLCSKGTHLGETVGLEGRLLAPMIGDRRASWDEALDHIAARMKATIAEHGPDSVAFYVSGQLLTEDYYVANKLMKGFIGSGNIDTNSRLCMASAVAAHVRAFGEDIVPCTYEDLDETDLILLVGSNTAWCHPVIWQRIEDARERRGTRIVVIDPRRTETAERADLHVQIAADGDVALFTALLDEMRRRGAVDGSHLARHCSTPAGFPSAPSSLGPIPSADEAIGGVPPSTFRALADLVATSERMVTLFSQGANQSRSGTDKGNAIINLHLATGRINLPGAGPFSITGQPNAMGGREVGGLANTLACHLGFSARERADVALFWNAPNICARPGLKAVDLFRAVHEGRVKFLWVMATNPAVSMPDAGFIREALARCETLVVTDVIADTDTARLAHVRLPALAWGEKDGTVTNSERRISRQRALFDAPGEARADWAILCDFAARMDWAERFAFGSNAAVFREYAAMTELAARHGRKLDLTALASISDEQYEGLEPFLWGGRHPLAAGSSHEDRKHRLIPVAAAPKGAADDAFPLRLNTGRYRDQWHTMTRSGLSPTLSQHRREPQLEIHPLDAERYNLQDGGLARVTTASGTALFRVACSDGQRRGEIFVPMHWTDEMAGEGRANLLSLVEADPVSGQPGFKCTPAMVSPIEPEWRAFLVSRTAPNLPGLTWWSRSRIRGGWLYELSGTDTLDVDTLLPAGERLEAADKGRGMQRAIVLDDAGTLLAALYLTRGGELPSRAWVSAQLPVTDASQLELLAGRAASPQPDRGPTVCICRNVGASDIRRAICSGAATVAAVGAETEAGTNCGSCRPAIARMLEAMLTDTKEAAE